MVAVVGEEEAVEDEEAQDGAAEADTEGHDVRGHGNEKDDGKDEEAERRRSGHLAHEGDRA